MPINPDKIRLLPQAFYTPQTDIYDKDTVGPVIQLGVTLNRFSGDLHIKAVHLEYIAREHLGMVTAETAEELRKTIAGLSAQLSEKTDLLNSLNEEIGDKFNQRLDRLFDGYANSRGISNDASPVASSEAGKPKATGSTKGKAKDISFDEL